NESILNDKNNIINSFPRHINKKMETMRNLIPLICGNRIHCWLNLIWEIMRLSAMVDTHNIKIIFSSVIKYLQYVTRYSGKPRSTSGTICPYQYFLFHFWQYITHSFPP